MCFVIAAFFKRRAIKNAHYLKVKGPVIIAMNHPNAFMDPIAFTTMIYPPRVFYLARGDAFKKGIVSAILESFGIIPIFRIQDGGKEGLKKNNETYERVNALLKRNHKIIIFAEGLCIQERRLRPLKKGVPRMVFGAMELHNLKNLTVVPVGLNYSNPSEFRSTLFCNVGKPLKIADYMASYNEMPVKTMNQFLVDLAPRMKELIVHINHKHNERLIEHIEEVYKYDFFKQQKLNSRDPEHNFRLSTKVVETINKTEETHPEKLKALYEKTKHYFTDLKKYQLKDWLINPAKQPVINYPLFILRCLFILMTLPLYIIGLIGNYLPYRLTHFITRKKVKVIEFKASFNMGIGAFLFLIYYLLQFFIIKAIAPNYWYAILFVFISFMTGWYCIYISPFRKKTWGIYRALKLKSKHKQVFEHLSKRRSEIIKNFEELL